MQCRQMITSFFGEFDIEAFYAAYCFPCLVCTFAFVCGPFSLLDLDGDVLWLCLPM